MKRKATIGNPITTKTKKDTTINGRTGIMEKENSMEKEGSMKTKDMLEKTGINLKEKKEGSMRTKAMPEERGINLKEMKESSQKREQKALLFLSMKPRLENTVSKKRTRETKREKR